MILPQYDCPHGKEYCEMDASAFAELIQFLDDQNLSLIMRVAPENGSRANNIALKRSNAQVTLTSQ